jgi:hypothetical protein
MLKKEGAAPLTPEGRGYPLTLTKEGAVRYSVKRRSNSPFSRRKEQPLIFRTEGAVLLCCRRKEQWPETTLGLVIHFAYMERAIQSTSHTVVLSLITVTDITVESLKAIRRQQVCAKAI